MGQSNAVRELHYQTNDAIQLRVALKEHGEDSELILTAIEGETNFNEAIALVYDEIAEDEILLDGLNIKIEEMKNRQARVKQSIETRKNIILMAMERASVPTVKTPMVTISKRATAAVAVIEDEALIPSQYFTPQDPKLDKQAVTNALRDKQTVPGAALSNGGITLSFRKA